MNNSLVVNQSTLPLSFNNLDQVRYEPLIQSSSASERSVSGSHSAGQKSAFAKAAAKIPLPMLSFLSFGLNVASLVLIFTKPEIARPMIAVSTLIDLCFLNGKIVGGPNDRLVEKPESPETVIKESIDQAFGSLPNRIQLEISKLPKITPELARRYNTTVAQLQTDQAQAVKTVSLHTVLHHLKSATDEHWDRHSRHAQKSEINAYAKSVILDKLTQLQTDEGLDSLVAQAAQITVAPQSQYGVSTPVEF